MIAGREAFPSVDAIRRSIQLEALIGNGWESKILVFVSVLRPSALRQRLDCPIQLAQSCEHRKASCRSCRACNGLTGFGDQAGTLELPATIFCRLPQGDDEQT